MKQILILLLLSFSVLAQYQNWEDQTAEQLSGITSGVTNIASKNYWTSNAYAQIKVLFDMVGDMAAEMTDTTQLKLAPADTSVKFVFLQKLASGNTNGRGYFVALDSAYAESGTSGIAYDHATAGKQWVRMEYLERGIIRPEWFGAKADGSTDDEVAFTNMFAFAKQNPDSTARIHLKHNVTYNLDFGDTTTLTVADKSVFMEGHNTILEFQEAAQQSSSNRAALKFAATVDNVDTLKTKTIYRGNYFIREENATMTIDSGAVVGLQVTQFNGPNPMKIGQYSWHTVKSTNVDTVYVREPIQYVWDPARGVGTDDTVLVQIYNNPPSFHLKGITFTFAGTKGDTSGAIRMRGFKNGIIENCNFYRTRRWGLVAEHFVNLKIYDCEFKDIDMTGQGYAIAVENGNVCWIENNYFSNFRSSWDQGSGGPSNFIFRGNQVFGDDYLDNNFRLGGDHYGPEQSIIEDNIFRGLAIGLNLRGNHHIIKNNLFSAVGNTTGNIIQMNASAGGLIVDGNIYQDITWKRDTVDSTKNPGTFVSLTGDSVTHNADPNVTTQITNNTVIGIRTQLVGPSSALDNDTLYNVLITGNKVWFDAATTETQRIVAGGASGPIFKYSEIGENTAHNFNAATFIKYDIRIDTATVELRHQDRGVNFFNDRLTIQEETNGNTAFLFDAEAASPRMQINHSGGNYREVWDGTDLDIRAEGGTESRVVIRPGTTTSDARVELKDDSQNTDILFSVEGDSYIRGGGISIGDATLDGAAIVEMTSTTQGMLPPRMTKAQRDAIGSPVEGLFVYVTDTDSLSFYTGTAWKNISF